MSRQTEPSLSKCRFGIIFSQKGIVRGAHEFIGDIEIITRPVRTLIRSNRSIDFVIRREIRNLILQEKFDRSDVHVYLRYVEIHKGHIGSNQAMPERVIAQSDSEARAYENREFYITPENLASLDVACQLSKEHGFDLYLSNSSISELLYQDPRFKRFYGDMVEALSGITAACPNMKYVLKVPPQYKPEQMDNVDHVATDKWSANLTEKLVEAVLVADQMPDVDG